MQKVYKLEMLETNQYYSLREVCQRTNIETDFVVQCVDYGILEVRGGQVAEDWRFPAIELLRIKKAFRLQRDLGIDFAGLAMVLDLLDDVESLRSTVDTLNRKLRQWEPEGKR